MVVCSNAGAVVGVAAAAPALIAPQVAAHSHKPIRQGRARVMKTKTPNSIPIATAIYDARRRPGVYRTDGGRRNIKLSATSEEAYRMGGAGVACQSTCDA